MLNSSEVASCALPPHFPWPSLVNRSIAVWGELITDEHRTFRDMLQHSSSLDEFLSGIPNLPSFWFFQLRSAFMSQRCYNKWSRDRLDDYILLPASPGFVLRETYVFVSHFWRTRDHPDPDGQYLRLHQAEIEPQQFSYMWVDWTCMPQSPRSEPEERYFHRCLPTISAIIRNCAFSYFYPPFEPRLWILYEITEYVLTCTNGIPRTNDIETYLEHVDEMLEKGVQATLEKHEYRCSYDRDRQYLTSWLELLVVLTQLGVDVDSIRDIMDTITWNPFLQHVFHGSRLRLRKFEGTLTYDGKVHTFTPFPQWDDGKYSQPKIKAAEPSSWSCRVM